VVKDASGNTIRFRVTELGNVVISGLPTAATQTQPMCVNTANGQVGPCAAGIGMGSVGPVGPKGDKGDKGDTGSAGAAGAAGAKGDKGDAGAQGLAGAKGDKGDTGAAGAAGAAGAVGAKGDKGDAGAQGLAGANGAQGAAGPAGRDGPKGDKGDKGDAGATGSSGPAGQVGQVGQAGPAGMSAADALYGDGSGGDCVNCISSQVGEYRMFSSIVLDHTDTREYPRTMTLRSSGAVTITARGIEIINGPEGMASALPGTGATPATEGSGGRARPGVVGQPTSARMANLLSAAKDPYPTGGAGASDGNARKGGEAGGGLRILAKGPITITGSRFLTNGGSATAFDSGDVGGGGGGGGGGVVILVSETSIVITDARFMMLGGAGAAGQMFVSGGGAGGGGGGGGGCLLLIAPTITVTNTSFSANGGPFGGNDFSTGADLRHGRGGGGSFCANGGSGAMLGYTAAIVAADPRQKATDGDNGSLLQIPTGTVRPSVLLAAY
jgi:Collagen triple helix repeat (20 copies)